MIAAIAENPMSFKVCVLVNVAFLELNVGKMGVWLQSFKGLQVINIICR